MAFNFNHLPGSPESEREVRPRPLAELEPGSVAVVVSVDTASPLGRRLLDLGFVPDSEVRMLRRAPLGDPVEYEVRGVRLCLRRSEAARISVRPR